MASLIETLLKETFGVATAPEQSTDNPNTISNVLLKETFGIATQPEQQLPPTTLLVTATLLQEAGLLNPLSEVGKATQPDNTKSATLEVMRQVAEKSWLEAIGIATAYTAQDIAKGAFQAAAPDGPTTLERLGAWGKETAKKAVAGVKNRHAATVNAKAKAASDAAAATKKAAADAEVAQQRDAAIKFQNDLNTARQAAAETERQYADARAKSASAEQQGATSAIVVVQSLQEIVNMINTIRNGNPTTPNPTDSDIIDVDYTG